MTITLTAGLFPGQGSQAVGMGQELAERYSIVRDTFAQANEVLQFDLTSLCFAGPADELKRTSNAQPALLTMSTAYWRLLQAQEFSCAVVAGHSLGEYSALVAAGALTFVDAVQLVRSRGLFMEQAALEHPGSMAAVIGASDEDVKALCTEVAREYGVLVPANFNAPGQVVVSGETAAISALRTEAKTRGMKAIPLAVSGPFHSPLMQPAADAFRIVLDGITINVPNFPIVPNVTATSTKDPLEIREALVRQITGSVQWVRSLKAIQYIGVSQYVEIGPGTVLTGLVQRTLQDVSAISVTSVIS